MPSLDIRHNRRVATVTLRRPEVHNALNPEMIAELGQAFGDLAASSETRVIVLAAEGKSFCAGADLHWMQAVAGQTFEENVAEAMSLARMLETIYHCPKPVVGRVQGAAFGGGVGLAAVCDIVVAAESAVFSFSETKLGLIPAVISPFVLRKLAPGMARRCFISAERIPAVEGRQIGLVSEVVPSEAELDEAVDRWTARLLANGPEAMAACKQLVEEISGSASPPWGEVLALAARRIAERRASEEGQEGMRAFLEKRPPRWLLEGEDSGVP
jgi:methylglutaconyl-CoA hydratase